MPLRACMQEHTYREYKTWLTWLDEQWHCPNRSDNYLIQVAMEIRKLLNTLRIFGSRKTPEAVDPDDFRVKFVQPGAEKMKTTPETQARSKAGWIAAVSIKKEK